MRPGGCLRLTLNISDSALVRRTWAIEQQKVRRAAVFEILIRGQHETKGQQKAYTVFRLMASRASSAEG
jgi:hypothetical protein